MGRREERGQKGLLRAKMRGQTAADGRHEVTTVLRSSNVPYRKESRQEGRYSQLHATRRPTQDEWINNVDWRDCHIVKRKIEA